MQEHGLPDGALEITDAALGVVITQYTREAGVRSLERMIGAIARKVAARLAEPAGRRDRPRRRPRVSTPTRCRRIPGPPRFQPESPFRTSRPGVATGVAWTETGGDVLFIEATLMPGGSQQIILTGQLGSVMQESARAAVSHIRVEHHRAGDPADFFDHKDLHVHVPAGAIPKDGPSAGVTMATAILSAIRNGSRSASDVAMTGEITLSGLVLPVGGIREKALAARRMGIKTFVLPARNAADLEELPGGPEEGHALCPGRETLEDVAEGRCAKRGSTGSQGHGSGLRVHRSERVTGSTRSALIVFYISGHGFGHASRDIEVLNALGARRRMRGRRSDVGAAMAVRPDATRPVDSTRSSATPASCRSTA